MPDLIASRIIPMTVSTCLALLLFSFVSSITPGPNNIMLFASGVNFGILRTVPHMFGIAIGFGVLLAAVGLGLGAVLTTVPVVFSAIKIAGGLYMLWLAWKIAWSGPVEAGESTGKPMTFMQAALFQWVNPKAWVMKPLGIVEVCRTGIAAMNRGEEGM